MLQLPRQDLSISYCKHLRTPVEKRIYEEFVNARNEIALDIGFVSANLGKATVSIWLLKGVEECKEIQECRKCRGILEQGDMAVTAPKLGEDAAWHPACFTCLTCEQLLVDLTYCVKEDKIFCERHYAELHKPRCSACDEVSPSFIFFSLPSVVQELLSNVFSSAKHVSTRAKRATPQSLATCFL